MRWQDRQCLECGEPDNPETPLGKCWGCGTGSLCDRCLTRHDDLHAETRQRHREVIRLIDGEYPERWL